MRASKECNKISHSGLSPVSPCQPEPIYNIIPLSFPHVNTFRTNLKQAIEEYVAEYNVCKCQPCHNGGSVILIDGSCTCLCPLAFEGMVCQSLKAEKCE